MASFLAGTMEGAEEKEKKVPAMPEILKKKQKNFTELKIKPYHKEDKQIYRTEIQMARMARKASNFYVPTEPKLALVIRNRGEMKKRAMHFVEAGDAGNREDHINRLNRRMN
ncbi:hypothetical protein Celaphus_00002371 [Cervus elaphus hippelaphus]|uniref:Uncharacterized protein n=1 Tax=Cervus elaphus hippelaphus TaxID=46360 RepID=A0A212CGE4_CEREH|nr:hypothetical protein Celaphus_00002371 [Cervus elaphus hippelaphus]